MQVPRPAIAASAGESRLDCTLALLRATPGIAQVRALTDSLRDLHGRDDLFICIDQEGGRVARMKAPEWLAYPPGEAFDRLYDVAPASAIEAARANAQALGMDLAEVGITVDCLPLLDVRQPGAHDVIGDRALGSETTRQVPRMVAARNRICTGTVWPARKPRPP